MTEKTRPPDTPGRHTQQQTRTASLPSRHQIERTASGLRTAAAEAGVTLPVDYSQNVASDGLARGPELGVTRLGAGVVIHTNPHSDKELPIVLGYADGRGQWYRDGRRHTDTTVEPSEQPTPGVTI